MDLNHLLTANRVLIVVFLFVCFVFFLFFVCGSVCGPVGVEDRNKIPDLRMTASSYPSSFFYPHYGRLSENRGNGAWCTRWSTTDRTEYLQVDMGEVHSVCAVATQGERISQEWTKSYKVHLSTDEVAWSSYKENNREKVTKIVYPCL